MARDTKSLRITPLAVIFTPIAVEMGIVPLCLSCLTIKAATGQKEPKDI